MTGKPTALADNCTLAANLKVSHSDAETPGCGSSKTIVRTWTVTDACGNATSKKQTISVLDTIKPTFDVPADTNVYLNGTCSANTDSTVTGKPTALADNCTLAANLKVSHSDAETPGCGSSKTIVRTWTVTDACGNVTSKKQTISVLDTIKPTFDVPGDTTLCRSAGGVFDANIAITGKPTALNDNCTPVTNLLVSYTDVDTSGTDPGKRVITREWTVKDACGNTTKKTQLITFKSYLDPAYVTFDCPPDTQVTLAYGVCDTLLGIGNPTFTLDPLLADLEYTITHDAPVDSIYSVASHLVTWTVTDVCGFSTNCSQVVDVFFPPCGTPTDSVSDWDGFKYSSVRIGCHCWTGENLRSLHYSDGTLIPVTKKYMESDSLEAIYGRLYSWYSTVRVEEGNDNLSPITTPATYVPDYVQGVCPDGWAVPTTEEYRDMFYNSGSSTDLVKSPSTLVWLPGMEGSAPNLFEAFGGGYYDGSTSKYMSLLGEAHFWTSTTVSHTCYADEFGIVLYCLDAIHQEAHKSLGYSIRCIRKK